MTAHADADDWDTYIGTARPSTLTALLRRASLDVNGELVSAVYDVTDSDVLAALAEATCEQAAFLLANMAADGIQSVFSAVSIGGVALSRNKITLPPAQFSQQAYQVLQDAGLTGGAPSTGY
jgi:hypothetical protein